MGKASQTVTPAKTTDVRQKSEDATLPASAATNGKVAVAVAPDLDSETKRYNIPEGLTRTQKRNLKKNIREKEKKALGKTGARGTAQGLYPEDPFQDERIAVLEHVEQVLASLPTLAQMKSLDVLAFHGQQQTTLDNLLSRLINAREELCTKVPRPDNRKQTPAVLMERIKELMLMPERDELALSQFEKQLYMSVCWENARKFQMQVTELRKKVEDRQRLNQKYLSTARDWERLQRLADRVSTLKSQREEGKPVTVTPQQLKRVQVEVSGEAHSLLSPPSQYGYRVERLFGVVLERLSDRSRARTFIVCGLPDDAQAAVNFLTQADWTGSMCVNVNPRVMPSLIGKGGRGIRHLEETFNCLIQAKPNGDVLVYGLKENGKLALEHIRSIKSDKISEPFSSCEVPFAHPTIGRALMTKFSRHLRNLETEHGVTVRCVLLDKESTAHGQQAQESLPFGGDCTSANDEKRNAFPDSTLQNSVDVQLNEPARKDNSQKNVGFAFATLRSRSSSALDAARDALTQLVSSWDVTLIPVESTEVLHSFFSRGLSGFRSLGRHDTASPREQFRVLMDATGDVAFIKSGNEAIALVGPAEATELIKPQVEQLLEKASSRPLHLTVPSYVAAVCCARSYLEELGENTGALIRRIRSPTASDAQSVSFIISGVPAATEKAKNQLESRIATSGCTTSLPIKTKEFWNKLCHLPSLRELEQKYACRIFLDRETHICTFVGGEDSIEIACGALAALDNLAPNAPETSFGARSGTAICSNSQNDHSKRPPPPSSASSRQVKNSADVVEWGASVKNGDSNASTTQLSANVGRITNPQWNHVPTKTEVTESNSLDYAFPTLGEVSQTQQPSKHGHRRRRGVPRGGSSGRTEAGGHISQQADCAGPPRSETVEAEPAAAAQDVNELEC